MKKTLVALAAVAATSAFAQSSVTMYGILDVSYGVTKSTSWAAESHKSTGLMEGTLAGNRIGFRGVEDLGSGMKAGFVVELAISPTSANVFGNRAGASGHLDATTGAQGCTGSATLFCSGYFTSASSQNRQSFVSLSGGYGELRAGYHYTNAYVLSSQSGYLHTAEVAGSDTAHLWGQSFVGGSRANGLTYVSPVFSGFKATVQYGSTATPAIKVDAVSSGGTTSKQARTSVMVDYANGPFRASVAHTRLAGLTLTPTLTQVGASYDFGVVSINGTVNDGDNDAGTDVSSWQLGANIPFGAFSFQVATGKSKFNGILLGADSFFSTTKTYYNDVKTFQVSAKYALSKRTTLYVLHGSTKADELNSAGTVNYGTLKGTTSRVGVNHTF